MNSENKHLIKKFHYQNLVSLHSKYSNQFPNVKNPKQFQQILEDLIDLLLSQSHGDVSLLQGPYLSQFIVKELFYLFRFWLQDESDEAEQTMELTDKLISFASEVLGSQIFSKGIDLGRTLWDQDLIRFKPQGLNILARALMQRYS